MKSTPISLSLVMWMQSEAERAASRLGSLLTHEEASGVIARLNAGDTLCQSLSRVASEKRTEVRLSIDGLRCCLPNDAWRPMLCAILAGISAAKRERFAVSPVWTAPDGLALYGETNSYRDSLVRSAQRSVICSTFNFQMSSSLWTALKEVSARSDVSVKLYVDTEAADASGSWGPSTAEIAGAMPCAQVFRTRPWGALGEARNAPVRNHAKFISIDHRLLLVTSANFSKSAERRNIEMGLKVENVALVQSIERQMALFEGKLYERITSRRA